MAGHQVSVVAKQTPTCHQHTVAVDSPAEYIDFFQRTLFTAFSLLLVSGLYRSWRS